MRERADRILDAAGELLVHFGYRKVTVEDVAEKAGIGKGTVYLHWRTKHQLFEALALREAIEYVDILVAELRRDPSTVLPHRLLPASLRAIKERPVLVAAHSSGSKHLEKLLANGPLRSQELLTVERFYAVMLKHGLLRDDIPHLSHTLGAVNGGFYLLDQFDPVGSPDADGQQEAIAFVVKNAFEPPDPPPAETVAAAAAEVVEVFEGIVPQYREWIYQGDR